jgi:hypothetical protein
VKPGFCEEFGDVHGIHFPVDIKVILRKRLV